MYYAGSTGLGLSLRVAEANLQCLILMLQKCPVPREDLSTLLGRCCATLDLPRDASSDEVRLSSSERRAQGCAAYPV